MSYVMILTFIALTVMLQCGLHNSFSRVYRDMEDQMHYTELNNEMSFFNFVTMVCVSATIISVFILAVTPYIGFASVVYGIALVSYLLSFYHVSNMSTDGHRCEQ